MKGRTAGQPTVKESPFFRLDLSKTQWDAINVLLDPRSGGRDTTRARALLSRQRPACTVIAQDTEPATSAWLRRRQAVNRTLERTHVLPLTKRQFEALHDILDETRPQAKRQRAREFLTRMPPVVHRSADYPRLSPPQIERYRRDPPRRPKVAGFKPGEYKPSPNGTLIDGDTGQPTTFEALYAKVQAATPESDFRTLLSYYGGKADLAPLYPEPCFNQIIEPFAGGASYSLLHCADHNVWLNDVYAPVVAIWKFLLRKDALTIIRERVPETVKRGTAISELTKDTDPEGLVWLMRSHAGQGVFGIKGGRRKVTPWGAEKWVTLRQRLEYWVPRIAHWKVTNLPYEALPNKKACWFIDPPYANAAGAKYAKGSRGIDYVKLAEWCKARHGQAIVRENAGATWLPFKTLTDQRRGIHSDDLISTKGEMIWTQVDERMGLFAE